MEFVNGVGIIPYMKWMKVDVSIVSLSGCKWMYPLVV